MVVGISMVRDEADVIGQTLRLMLEEVDYVIVADNASTDGTSDILIAIAEDYGRVELRHDPEIGYYQSRKMTALARRAADIGATFVVPFDADERWLTRSGRRVADELRSLPDHVLVARADLYDHVCTALDPDGPPLTRMTWRRPAPAPLPKVACRPLPDLTIEQGNHAASYTSTDLPPTVSNVLTVRHFPLRSVEQMIRKARNGAEAYAATDLPDHVGGHWRGWGALSDENLADAFRKYFWRAEPDRRLTVDDEVQPPLVRDPCPLSR